MTLAVFTAVLDAATLTAGAALWRHRHKTPAPGKGREPTAAAPPDAATPAPVLLPHERDDLNTLYHTRSPFTASAGQVIADSLRQRFHWLDDHTLGVLTADLYEYARAMALSLPAQCPDAQYVAECIGLAAEHLTRLERMEEVRFDQP